MTGGRDRVTNTILAFDTSSRHCSISVSREQQILLEYNFISDNDLATSLLPAMEFVLRSLNLGIEDLSAFAAAIGPGLFTGIRIGLSTLKGLNLQLNKPTVSITTLEAIAFKHQDTKSAIIPLIDARRGEIYMAGYQLAGDGVNEILAPALVSLEDLPSRLSGVKSFKFVGSGSQEHKAFLQEHFPGIKRRNRSSFLASEVARLAETRLKTRTGQADPQKLEPFYIRKPDAETKQQPPPSVNQGRQGG